MNESPLMMFARLVRENLAEAERRKPAVKVMIGVSVRANESGVAIVDVGPHPDGSFEAARFMLSHRNPAPKLVVAHALDGALVDVLCVTDTSYEIGSGAAVRLVVYTQPHALVLGGLFGWLTPNPN